ncbi:microfibril-associated glycoprotein 4-like [Anopheles darlingi]|uniref:microfibril-associated glycoprotein 4-like n=1 Tax=Anopheles darlingi TaxID=43151 RepID=UPI0021003403|nr:microfibril-associated glycoprotein 4-like [Anopheles darlingi]
MKLTICMALFCGSVYAATTSNPRPEDVEVELTTPKPIGFSETGMEKLMRRFDQLDRKLLDLQNVVKRHENTIQRLEQDVGRNLSVILDQQTSCATLEQALHSFKSRTPECVTPTINATQPKEAELPTYASCKDVPANVSGVYLIRINNASAPFKVYCEMDKFEGGWIVLQHRFNGSVDFNRNWDQYRDGFGELDSEFWIGLEHIHQLTTARKFELLVVLKDFYTNYGYARYSAFQVGSESDQYSLKTLGSYSGTAGDSLIQHKGKMFSTKDRDNDESLTDNYAVSYEGAWWHGGGYSSLNGPYENIDDFNSNWWFTLRNDIRGMSFSRMMIREI